MKAQEENRLTSALILIALDLLLWGLGGLELQRLFCKHEGGSEEKA